MKFERITRSKNLKSTRLKRGLMEHQRQQAYHPTLYTRVTAITTTYTPHQGSQLHKGYHQDQNHYDSKIEVLANASPVTSSSIWTDIQSTGQF